MRFVVLIFYHDSNPSRPLINRLKGNVSPDLLPQSISTVCITLLSQTHIAESIVPDFSDVKTTQYLKISAVCILTRKQSPQCTSHRKSISAMIHSGVIDLAVFLTPEKFGKIDSAMSV